MVRAWIATGLFSWLAFTATARAQSPVSRLSWRPFQVLETSLLYHPIRASEHWLPPPPQVQVFDVWLRLADGTNVHAWWFPCPESQGALLFCHGNAGNLSHRTGTVLALMRVLKRSVLIFDYPGYGRSEGWPSEVGCYAAADAAYDWLTGTMRVPPDRVVLFGKSLGGGVAADLAMRRPHEALVLVKTFTSIPAMARKLILTALLIPLVSQCFDNLAKIGRCPCPVFIAHGDRDCLIPLAQARQLFEAASEPKRFFLLQGSDHNDPLPPDFHADLAEFLAGCTVPAAYP